MSDSLAATQLQSFVRRIENVEDEIKVLNEDKASIYKEARAEGFDVKIIRQVIKDRAKDAGERDEQNALYEIYWNAVHGIDPDLVRAHVEIIDEFDAETDEITHSDVVDAAPADVRDADDLTAAQALTGRQVAYSADEANEAGSALAGRAVEPDAAGHGFENANEPTNGGSDEARYDHSVEPFARPHDDLTANEIATPAGGSHHVVDHRAHTADGEGAHNAPSAPSNITTLRRLKLLRPNCLRPERCGGQGREHCWDCRKAMTQSGAA